MDKQSWTRRSSVEDAEDNVPATWQVGDVILDQYEVTGKLGEGGMGTVYKVHHRGWNTDLAVKSPKPEIFTKSDGKQHFEQEAETWVKLGLHPHIVSCYYVRTLGRIPRVFAEYVGGGNLSEWIRDRRLYRGGREKALERMLDVAIQFAWGLYHAHEQGVVHQDIKPANVMLTADSVAKVTDFGLAKARPEAGAGRVFGGSGVQSILVSSGGMTPAYCSPEQLTKRVLSRKTDIWSWGVSVLEMFVGEVTWFTGAVADEALEGYQEMGAEDDSIPLMPASMVDLLKRCFQKNPADRPANMDEVATVLQTIYRQVTGSPYPREAPKAAEALADSLNNRALSLLDLGKSEEGEQLWVEALKVDPQHIEAFYNWKVVRWYRGELTDEELVQQMEVLRATHSKQWQSMYLLALVQLERGEVDAAVSLLKEASQLAPEEQDVQMLLEQVQRTPIPPVRYLHPVEGHEEHFSSVCISAAGNLALVRSRDDTVQLWEVATGCCLRTFQGHTDQVCSISLSADGRFALSGAWDKTVRLWDVATGQCLRVFEGHTNPVSKVTLSADGRLALSLSYASGEFRLWEVATGRCLVTLSKGYALPMSLSSDGKLVFLGVWERKCSEQTGSPFGYTLGVWEVATGRCLCTLKGHTDTVNAVCLNVDGSLALTGSGNTGTWFNEVGYARDNTLRLWEVATGKCLRIFRGHTGHIVSVCLSSDGRLALSGSMDGTIRLWEVATGRCLRTFQQDREMNVRAIWLSPDGHQALCDNWGGFLQLELPGERFCTLRISRISSHADTSYLQSRVQILLKQAEQALAEANFASALNMLQEARSLPGYERAPQCLEAWSRLAPNCRRVGLRAAWFVRVFEGHTPCNLGKLECRWTPGSLRQLG